MAWDNNEIDTAWRQDNAKALSAFETTNEFERLYQQYRIGMLAMREGDKKLAKKALGEVQKSLKNNYTNTNEAALYSATLGQAIALSPFRAVFLAGQAEEALEYSFETETQHAPTLMVRAIALYNTPSMMGGDKERAVTVFEEAISLYEQQEAWGYEDAWLWKIRALQATGQIDQAKADLAKALELFPDYAELQELQL
jgi:tetratricopeptide (TPR) repeat protein